MTQMLDKMAKHATKVTFDVMSGPPNLHTNFLKHFLQQTYIYIYITWYGLKKSNTHANLTLPPMPPPLSGNTALSRDYYIITIIVPYSVHHSSLTKALFPGKGGIRWVGPLDFHETSCPNTNARSNMCFSPEKKHTQGVSSLVFLPIFSTMKLSFQKHIRQKKTDRLRKRPTTTGPPKIPQRSASPTSRIHVRNHVHRIPFTELPILKGAGFGWGFTTQLTVGGVDMTPLGGSVIKIPKKFGQKQI